MIQGRAVLGHSTVSSPWFTRKRLQLQDTTTAKTLNITPLHAPQNTLKARTLRCSAQPANSTSIDRKIPFSTSLQEPQSKEKETENEIKQRHREFTTQTLVPSLSGMRPKHLSERTLAAKKHVQTNWIICLLTR